MTAQPNTTFLTPVGRIVAGDCFTASTTDAENRPLVIKTGPNAGQPRVEYYIGLAIPKTDAGFNDLRATIYNEARAAFPNMFDAGGNCVNPKFAFKIVDGDSQIPNTVGKKPCDKEGYPGNWIVNFSNGFAPKCYTQGGEALITDPAMLKRGYFVRVYGTVKSNGSTQQPGVFLNFSMVELVGYGEEIHSGPDGATVFGAQPASALPAGASATPVASATPLAAPPTTAAPATAAPTPSANFAPPAATGGPAPTPSAPPAATASPSNVAPAQDFLTPPPAAPPVAVTPTYTVDGVAYTADQLKAAGWNDAQIAAVPQS